MTTYALVFVLGILWKIVEPRKNIFFYTMFE